MERHGVVAGGEALWDGTLGCAGSIIVCLVDHGLLDIIMGYQEVGWRSRTMGYLSRVRGKEIRCPSVG